MQYVNFDSNTTVLERLENQEIRYHYLLYQHIKQSTINIRFQRNS